MEQYAQYQQAAHMQATQNVPPQRIFYLYKNTTNNLLDIPKITIYNQLHNTTINRPFSNRKSPHSSDHWRRNIQICTTSRHFMVSITRKRNYNTRLTWAGRRVNRASIHFLQQATSRSFSRIIRPLVSSHKHTSLTRHNRPTKYTNLRLIT
jgi:hypothetical protein